jgi:hypothetical protein
MSFSVVKIVNFNKNCISRKGNYKSNTGRKLKGTFWQKIMTPLY